ncbi:MAG: hypothetical protein PHW60_14555 [Kiritimatiellae bacterium]|nr:hypothetical protein [Kiritimatiellia bacterium]
MKTVLLLTVAMCMIQLSLIQVYGEEAPKAAPAQTVAPAPAPFPAPGPTLGPTLAADKQQLFQPVAMDPKLMRQSMQSRSEYDDLNRRIMARQAKLYEENARIKELQTQLRDLQKKIDRLMAEDEELNTLKKQYEAITPEIPMGARRGSITNAMPFFPGR